MKDTTKAWQRSSYCSTAGCIEVVQDDGLVRLRDSKNPELPALEFTQDEWTGFQHLVLALGKSS